jgi:CBS-domain-containing membrane protein
MMGYEIKYLNLLGMSANEYVEVLRGSVDQVRDIPSYSELPEQVTTFFSQEDLCVCQPEATISHTIKLMLKRGTHRVFVVDQQCRVKSVVSISDVMRALVDPFMT